MTMQFTKEELQKLRVVELKVKLTSFGLTTTGLKADLVNRLCEHYKKLDPAPSDSEKDLVNVETSKGEPLSTSMKDETEEDSSVKSINLIDYVVEKEVLPKSDPVSIPEAIPETTAIPDNKAIDEKVDTDDSTTIAEIKVTHEVPQPTKSTPTPPIATPIATPNKDVLKLPQPHEEAGASSSKTCHQLVNNFTIIESKAVVNVPPIAAPPMLIETPVQPMSLPVPSKVLPVPTKGLSSLLDLRPTPSVNIEVKRPITGSNESRGPFIGRPTQGNTMKPTVEHKLGIKVHTEDDDKELMKKAQTQIEMLKKAEEKTNSAARVANVSSSGDSRGNSSTIFPRALEEVLNFLDSREKDIEESFQVNPDDDYDTEPKDIADADVVADDELEEDVVVAGNDSKKTQKGKSKNQKKKEKKKKRKAAKYLEKKENGVTETMNIDSKTGELGVEVEYITETPDVLADPTYRDFIKVFDNFKVVDNKKEASKDTPNQGDNMTALQEALERRLTGATKNVRPWKAPHPDEEDDDEDMEEKEKKEEEQQVSRKKLRKMNRLSVAELKQLVSKPDVVEMHDVTAKDPRLLVHLKSVRNTVPVPRHWCFKRKYLQGKRGIEKPPFDLPDFIKNTGIMEMRQALMEKEDQQTMKTKMRGKVRPKMGKIDIDYQKLHDAFFKFQTKPKMTIHGDLYYEGKELETRLKEKKPGDMSEELRVALGMPAGSNRSRFPPPWLIAMQRYGPPPSYPNIKIPGLNCPIPEGCTFGYHAGGWGKPPVDELGRPLYGDVFGVTGGGGGEPETGGRGDEEGVLDKSAWGELESESEESEEEESSEEEDTAGVDGLVTPMEGAATPSGGASTIPIMGVETPDTIELRKKAMETSETPQLYTVVGERKAAPVGGAMMASGHTYDVNPSKKKDSELSGVEVSLDPGELELEPATLQAKYEQTVRQQQQGTATETGAQSNVDLSDLVAEHGAKQKQKRKNKQQETTAKPAKRQKEFKF